MHLPALLCCDTLVSEVPGKSIKISLQAVLTQPYVKYGKMAHQEGLLAPAAQIRRDDLQASIERDVLITYSSKPTPMQVRGSEAASVTVWED